MEKGSKGKEEEEVQESNRGKWRAGKGVRIEGNAKNAIFTKFSTLGGSCTHPLFHTWTKFGMQVRAHVYFSTPNFIVTGIHYYI